MAENAEEVKMESIEIEENLSIDEMSALMDNTQSAVVWPKPAPVHGEMEFWLESYHATYQKQIILLNFLGILIKSKFMSNLCVQNLFSFSSEG